RRRRGPGLLRPGRPALGMLAPDFLVLGGPLLLHILDLGLADHRIETRAEMAGNLADFADPPTRSSQGERQVLRSDHDHRDDDDQQQFGWTDVKHGRRPKSGCQRLALSLAGWGLAAPSVAGFASWLGPSSRCGGVWF